MLCINCHKNVKSGGDRHFGLDPDGNPIDGKANGCTIPGKTGEHGKKLRAGDPPAQPVAGLREIIAGIAKAFGRQATWEEMHPPRY